MRLPRYRPEIDKADRLQAVRSHFIGIAKPFRFIAQFTFKARQATFPMPPVSFSLAPLLGHEIEGELVGIELFGRLGDT